MRDTSGQDRPIPAIYSKNRLRRRLAILAGAGLALVVMAAGVYAVQRMEPGRSVSESRLGIATVELGPFVKDVSAEGKVVAAISPTVYAPHAGNLSLRAKAGDAVTKGQVLGDIESPDLRARLVQEEGAADALRTELKRAEVEGRQQRAALKSECESAGVDLQTAQNDLARQTKAFEAGAVAGMQVDRARDALEKARISLAHAESAMALKEDSLKFELQSKQQALQRQLMVVQDLRRQVRELALVSPVDGQIGQVLSAARATVSAGTGLLTVVDLTALEVQIQVAESFARDLAIGMSAVVQGNGQTWPGRVSGISPEVVNGEVAARVRFEGAPPVQLRQNQRLAVRVVLDQRDRVLAVSRGSFVEEGGGRFAYVLVDGQALKRPIRLGMQSLSKVEVLDGLRAGDRVVVTGADAFAGAERVTLSR
jgi:HlyD family secretion protein